MRYTTFVSFVLKVESNEIPLSVRERLRGCGLLIESISTISEVKVTQAFSVSANSKTDALEKGKIAFEKMCKEKNIISIGLVKTNVQNVSLMNTHNSHNADLVDKINFIWQSEKYDRRLKTIATALYERDIEECNEKNIFINEYENDLYGFLYEMFMHVCDDADLEVVINFVRARNSKGQTIWADSDSWEE